MTTTHTLRAYPYPATNALWFASVDGHALRNKIGIVRRFGSEDSALLAARVRARQIDARVNREAMTAPVVAGAVRLDRVA